MTFSSTQVRFLKRDLSSKCIKSRSIRGRELPYIEGWHAIAEANRIFGHDGWDRETVESKCILGRETRGFYTAVYIAKVRITVRAGEKQIIREGHGAGTSQADTAGEAHDFALKAAETDATKRALATFGRPFGLGLYLRSTQATSKSHAATAQSSKVHEEIAKPDSLALAHKSGEELRSIGTTPFLDRNQAELTAKTLALGPSSTKIDKSRLTFGEPRRLRDRNHLRFVAGQPCLLCGRIPSDPHHLRFAQSPALGKKVSDEFTVPLCRTHHRQLHHSGNEVAWWEDLEIDPLPIAKALWDETHGGQLRSQCKAAQTFQKMRERSATLPPK